MTRFEPLGWASSNPLSVFLITLTTFIAGVAGQIFSTLWYTTLHTVIPADKLSRVSAYDHLGSIGIAPLGIVAAGFLYEIIGPTATLVSVAAVIAMVTVPGAVCIPELCCAVG